MEDGEVCVTVYMYIFIHDSRLYQMLVYLSLVPTAVFVKSLWSYRAGRHQPVPTCLLTRAARRGHHFIVNLRNTKLHFFIPTYCDAHPIYRVSQEPALLLLPEKAAGC